MNRYPLLILPGIGNSGADHWQSHWQRREADAIRVEQAEWNAPVCKGWLATLVAFLRVAESKHLVAAHSSACPLLAHLVHDHPDLAVERIAGALLVAPSDPEGEHYPPEPTGFGPVPLCKMPFPAIVVSSDNDIYVSAEKACAYATAWGARFVLLNDAGHINVDSGHGEWPEGYALVQSLHASA